VQHDYANCWVYSSIAPLSGERFFLVLPALNADHMQLFLEEFAQANATTFNILLMDNSGAHTAKRLKVPANVFSSGDPFNSSDPCRMFITDWYYSSGTLPGGPGVLSSV
jgi:hypothetical protein